MITLPNTILFMLFVLSALASVRLGGRLLKTETQLIINELEKKSALRDRPRKNLADKKRENARLKEKLQDLSRLYTVTKEMSSDMRFGELFASLKNFLEENVTFGKFKIAIFKYEKGERVIDKVYEITGSAQGYIEPEEPFLDLIERTAGTKKALFLEGDKDLFNHGLAPGIKNAAAIPLLMRKKVISAIIAENIDPDEYEKFLILASQVALQIERISLFDSVEKLSITDGLTGTSLRRHFLERMKEEFERARQCRMKVSFIMADLDFFKKCNDNFGHLVGDVVLKEVADILKKNVREIDLVGRFGGEEFCVLLPEADKSGAVAVSERIREAVEDYVIKAYDESVRITISMGVSCFPEDSKNMDELIENADRALYRAKGEGRNKVCLAP